MRPEGAVAASCGGLTRTYATATGVVHALRGVDAQFSEGAVTAVVGASGSGKSTLLRLLAGLDAPTAGRVVVGRLELGSLRGKQLREVRRRLVGYVFQRPSDNFVPHLTIGEHLRLAAAFRSGAPPDPDGLLEELGIRHRRDNYPRDLSGGEQQRAAFAQVLMAGTRLVVADEPTAELDTRSSEDLLELVRGLAGLGIAFVLATHDPSVRRMADFEIELDHGIVRRVDRIEAVGDSEEPIRLHRPPDGQSVLRLEEVRKTYRRGPEQVHALDGVSLEVRAGDLVGVIGRSGSGKTTLLNVVAGWERQDTGRVTWSIPSAEAGTLAWHDLAVLPQKFGLIEELTIRQNVEYPLRLDGVLVEARGRVEALLVELGLDELAGRLPAETSVGQQQRTALARALVVSPRVLLADEPSGHQDAVWARSLFRALRGAAAAGTACIVATHDEELARHLDTVYGMANGRLRASSAALAE